MATGDEKTTGGPSDGAGRGRRAKQPFTMESLDRRLRAAENLGDAHEERLNEIGDWQRVAEEGLVQASDGVKALKRANSALVELVEKVREEVAQQEQPEDEEEKKRKKPVVSWLTADADQAAEIIEKLAEWIPNVYYLFAKTKGLPDCWMRHPAAVERLVVLRGAWVAAYADGAPVVLRLDWFNRHLGPLAAAIEKELSECVLDKHLVRNPADFQPRRITSADDVDDVISWWTATRGMQPEPAPSRDALVAEEARIAAARHKRHGG